MADSENGKKLSPVVADNGPAPVIDLSLDLCVVLEALAVLHGLAEDGVAVAHEGDLHVARVGGGGCERGIWVHYYEWRDSDSEVNGPSISIGGGGGGG